MRCRRCGQENPDGFRFCGYCSAALDGALSGDREVRKTATILFCDVTGSTALGERLDAETLRRVMRRYFDEMRRVIESHGGSVEKFIGDAVMAVFGIPAVHEDDALRAVRAAQEMRVMLTDLNGELEREHGVSITARTGVNTGEVVAGAGDETLVTGDAVNVAARLEQLAAPGEILLGATTWSLVRDAVSGETTAPLKAKGKNEPLDAFRLVAVTGDQGRARRFDVPLIGRGRELATLQDALARASDEGSAQLVAIEASAGIGKSRLVKEFVERAAPVRVLRGHCPSYGTGVTYWPVVEMVAATAGIDDRDDAHAVRGKLATLVADSPDADRIVGRLGQLFGHDSSGASVEETHWAIHTLIRSLAPAVVVFEDAHWAEPTLVDLIEELTERIAAPILVIVTARTEFFDRRPAWRAASDDREGIALGPLSEDESEQLVAALLDRARLPVDVRRRVVAAAEGNALFVEQLVAMLVDDGTLRREGGRWSVHGDVDEIRTPSSISAVLEARLERLRESERWVLERGAIEGRRFHVAAVQALSPEQVDVPRELRSLAERDLVEPASSEFVGDQAFRFRHALVRDAAYRRIPKRERADLHAEHATWLERSTGERVKEIDEVVGYHLEQAVLLRRELGPVGDATHELAALAASHLIAGGRRAAARGDARASSNLLARATALLDHGEPHRTRILAELSVQLLFAGQPERALDVVREAEAAIADDDASSEIAVRFARLTLDGAMEPEGVAARMRRDAADLIPRLEAVGDDAGLARAWGLIADSELWAGNNAGMLRGYGASLDHAERAGDRATAGRAAMWMMIALYAGMTPVDEALETLTSIEARASDTLEATAWAEVARGRLVAMLGEVDAGRQLVASGRSRLAELGLAMNHAGSSMEAAALDEIVGDIDRAASTLRAGYQELVTLGERGYLSTAAARLARCLAIGGGLDEAERLVRISEDAAATDDVYSQIACRQAKALVHATRRDDAAAQELIDETVSLLDGTDDCYLWATTFEDAARVHTAAGRTEAAEAALGQVIEVWERKRAGWVADVIRRRLAALARSFADRHR